MSKIAITIPGFSPHGGINVIIEWANQLSRWHDVTLISDSLQNNHWYPVKTKVTTDIWLQPYDALIVTSPHFSHLLGDLPTSIYGDFTGKRFVFCQMLEHLFRPNDKAWQKRCEAFYNAEFPMFYISRWNRGEMGRKNDEDLYVQNGINFELFPIENPEKSDRLHVLIEGWEPGNPTKDVKYLGAQIGRYVKQKYNAYVMAYGGKTLKFKPQYCSEYRFKPDLKTLNDLYSRAHILVKASRFDASSTVPFEAATKNCVTVRGIERGDDALIDGFNCYKRGYNLDQLIEAVDKAVITDNSRLISNFREHLSYWTWERILEDVNKKVSL